MTTPRRLRYQIGALGTMTVVVLVLGTPGLAFGAEGYSQFGPILFGLAMLVVAAKAGGLLVQRLGQPPVLGELLVGIALAGKLQLGPSGILVIHPA